MEQIEELRRLRERVLHAQAGERDLDARLVCGLFGHSFIAWEPAGLTYALADGRTAVVEADQVARLTGSLDAATALLGLMMPDWVVEVQVRPDRSTARLLEEPPPFGRTALCRSGPGAEGAARAVVLALLAVLLGESEPG